MRPDHCLLLALLLLPASVAMAEDPLRIFILHSYSQEYPWTKTQHEGFTRRYYGGNQRATLISTEYLDSKRREFDADYAQAFSRYLDTKYTHYRPDLVYVSDDNALTFALDRLPASFADAPIIFSGVNNTDIEQQRDPARVTGVLEKKNIGANLELLQQMDPKINDILVVGDASETYHAIENEIRRQLQQYPHINARYIADRHIENILPALRQTDTKYLFLTTLGSITNNQGHVLTLQQIVGEIVAANAFIVLSMEDAYVLDGVLGGLVTSGRLQGKAAADMALAYLQGTPINQLAPVSNSPGELTGAETRSETARPTKPPTIVAAI